MITLEKRCKSNFLVQKMTPKLVVLHSLKKQSLKKTNFFKKILPAYLCRQDLQKG